MNQCLFRRELSALSLIALLLLAPASFARATPVFDKTPQTIQQSRPFPPTQYIPDHDFDTRHVALDLRFDWEREQLIGTETMSFKPLVTNLQSIELDAGDMTIKTVRLVNGGPLQFEMDAAKQKLRIALGRSYQPADELTIVIDYHTNTSHDRIPGLVGIALRFIKPSPDDPTRPKQIWSQGESEYNHYWFPVYDHPNDFFTSEITATVEKPLSVISNGKLLETKENSDGTRTFHWKIDQPHASYLTSIVVGEYVPVTAEYRGYSNYHLRLSERTQGRQSNCGAPDGNGQVLFRKDRLEVSLRKICANDGARFWRRDGKHQRHDADGQHDSRRAYRARFEYGRSAIARARAPVVWRLRHLPRLVRHLA